MVTIYVYIVTWRKRKQKKKLKPVIVAAKEKRNDLKSITLFFLSTKRNICFPLTGFTLLGHWDLMWVRFLETSAEIRNSCRACLRLYGHETIGEARTIFKGKARPFPLNS